MLYYTCTVCTFIHCAKHILHASNIGSHVLQFWNIFLNYYFDEFFSPTFFGPSFRIHNHSLLSPISPLFSLPLSSLFLCHLVLDLSAKGVWKPAFLGNKWGWKMVVSPLNVQTITYLSLFSTMFHSAVLVSPCLREFLVQPLQMVNLQSSSRLVVGGRGGGQRFYLIALIFSLSRVPQH